MKRIAGPGAICVMQVRHGTELTAEEYVTCRGWENASRPACRRGRGRVTGCRLHGHGTYERVTPEGMRVRRWYCRDCQETVSCLPDCLASRVSGTLEEIEEVVDHVEREGKPSAVERFRPLSLDPVSAWRFVTRRCEWVKIFLKLVRGLTGDHVGMAPTLAGMRACLSPEVVHLRDLRQAFESLLPRLPHPLGFRPPTALATRPRGPGNPAVGTSLAHPHQNGTYLMHLNHSFRHGNPHFVEKQ